MRMTLQNVEHLFGQFEAAVPAASSQTLLHLQLTDSVSRVRNREGFDAVHALFSNSQIFIVLSTLYRLQI